MINATELLRAAKKNKKAIPQFNINNLEWTKYILEECNRLSQPVILGVSEGAIKYMGGYNVVVQMVKSLITDLEIKIPVVLHLDHGSSIESCEKAINAGFTSVMIDASKFPLAENIKITNAVIALAHPENVSVEAEVGQVGGQEDELTADLAYAKVDDCQEFIKQTQVDFFAPALGSVHGFYQGEPKLDFERMNKISELCDVPLVLHGGTGIPDDMIKHAISCGIAKININTELQAVWAQAVREKLTADNEVYDPRKIIGAGEQSIKTAIQEKLAIYNE